MVEKLDDRATLERLDPHGLLGRIEGLPEQCAEARRLSADFTLPDSYGRARQVVVLGMGGSAIAGDILRSLAFASGRLPVAVVRGYDAPSFVGAETLVVACSHSGNTEETLAAFRQAAAAGARLVAVTTGGRLRELARDQGAAAFLYGFDGEPRSALGHQLMALLALGERVGLLDSQGAQVAETVSLMRGQRDQIGFSSPLETNPAKQIAARLHGRLPVIVGAGVLTDAAYRWKTQLNENAKCLAFHEELPELNHNSIEGFGHGREVAPQVHVVLLHNDSLHRRVLLRYEATEEALARAGISHERVSVGGASPLASVLCAVFLGDLVSYYLGLLNDVEPAPVEALDRLKARLAAQPE